MIVHKEREGEIEESSYYCKLLLIEEKEKV